MPSVPEHGRARLIVRRVEDAARQDELFPVWRYHPFFTDFTEPAADADITHRRHAVIETVFADLIDGPLAHMPSGRFAANSAWVLCAAIAHNLLRAAGALAGPILTRARGAALRRKLVIVAARLARPERKPVLHLPARWPWAHPWRQLRHATICAPSTAEQPVTDPATRNNSGRAGQTRAIRCSKSAGLRAFGTQTSPETGSVDRC